MRFLTKCLLLITVCVIFFIPGDIAMEFADENKRITTPVLINVLGYIPGLSYFSNFYKKIIGTADPRADNYLAMKSPDPTASLVLGYLMISLFIGPKIMKNRKTPVMVKGLLYMYNFIAISINAFLAVALTNEVITSKYKSLCEPVEQEQNVSWRMTLLYMFHLSKIFELLDTLFLVWKNSSRQMTFLHLYHHSTIIPATWIGVKFAPGGTTCVIAMINCWVHVFMYTYYQLAAAKMTISLKFKKLMTMIQITQFMFTLLVCSYGLWIDRKCSYPEWILWWLFIYMLSFLLLFGKFFYKTYNHEATTFNPKQCCGDLEDNTPRTAGKTKTPRSLKPDFEREYRNGDIGNPTPRAPRPGDSVELIRTRRNRKRRQARM